MPPESPPALVARIDALATRHVTPFDAGSMVWRVWGEGPPLVLLHGASGSWTHWIRNILPLASRFQLFAPDMPGFGDSDALPEPHTAEALADAVAGSVGTMIPARKTFDVAGFSLGGIVGGLVAARLGGRVQTLVLLGAGGFGLTPVAMPALSPIRSDMTPAEIERAHRENLQLLMIADPGKIDDVAVFIQMENIRRARFKSGTIPVSDVLVKALPAIDARIVGVWGARDAFTGARAERIDEYRGLLAAVQPTVDFRVIPASGHWTIYEAADDVNAILLQPRQHRRLGER